MDATNKAKHGSELRGSGSKKRKFDSSSTSVKYDQKYLKSWETAPEYRNWISSSQRGQMHAHCQACRDDISIKAGKAALNRHLETYKHKKNVNSLAKQPKLESMTSMLATSELSTNVKNGDIRIAAFIAEHDAPFASTDHLTSLMKAVCIDSEIAKKLSCGRTKATAIVKNVLGKEAESILVEEMKRKPFSIIIDESKDISDTENLVIVVRIASDACSRVTDQHFALVPIADTSALGIYTVITKELDRHQIPWHKNLIGLAADGANAMMGKNHSVSTLFLSATPRLFVIKCICHSFALCASAASSVLPRTPETLVRNISNYLSNSPKRRLLKQFQEFLEMKPHKMLHPAATRWLSLHQVVSRVNQKWDALKLFFIDALTTDKAVKTPEQILYDMNSPLNKMFLEFLEFVLPLFNNLNLLMQSDDPQICNLLVVEQTLRTFMEFYIKPSVLASISLEKVDYKNPRNFRPLEEIYCGAKAAVTIASNPTFDPKMIDDFRKTCLEFYMEAMTQIRKRVPLENTIFKELSFLKPTSVKDLETIAPLASIPKTFNSQTLLRPILSGETYVTHQHCRLMNPTFPSSGHKYHWRKRRWNTILSSSDKICVCNAYTPTLKCSGRKDFFKDEPNKNGRSKPTAYRDSKWISSSETHDW